VLITALVELPALSGVFGLGRAGVGGQVGRSGGLGLRGSLAFGSNLLVQGVESSSIGAVEVEPPIADEIVLVEDGAVGAEEGVLGQAAVSVGGADVEGLALGVRVSVVPSLNLTSAVELGLRNLGKDGVVGTRGARDRLQEPVGTLVVLLIFSGQSLAAVFGLVGGTVLLGGSLSLATLAGPLGTDGDGDSCNGGQDHRVIRVGL